MIYKKKKGRITLGSIAFNAANLKLVTINSKSSDIVRRTVFGSLAVVMVLTNLAFLTYFLPESVSAAEATVLPNTDVANAWGSTGGTSDSSCAGGTFCDFVDEDVQGTPDTTNYVNTGSQTGIGEVTEEYGMTTVSNVSSATSITIDIEAQSSTNANGGTLDNINIDLRIGGSLQGATTVTPAFNSWTTYSSSAFTGTWTQADIDGMQVVLTRTVEGGGNPTNQEDDVRLAAVSARVTYTPSIQWEQSAYQWFENQDTGNSTWAQTFDLAASGNDVANAIEQTADGGYVVVGEAFGIGAGGWDVALSKFNISGAKEWTSVWGTTASDRGSSVTETSDGGFVIAGNTWGDSQSAGSAFISKIDSSGSEVWSRYIGTSGQTDYYYKVVETSDNGLVALGESQSYTAGNADMILTKFNSSGVEQWTKTVGSTDIDAGNDLTATSDGGFVVVSTSSSWGAGSSDVLLTKFNSSGIEQWSKTWGTASVDSGNGIAVDGDGNFYVTGATLGFGTTDRNMILVKFNSSGVEQWSKTWGTNSVWDEGLKIEVASSGDIFVSGISESYGGGGYDASIVKFNSSGVEQWSTTFGDTGDEYAYDLALTNSGGVLAVGSATSYGANDQSLIINVDSNGTIDSCSDCAQHNVSETDVDITEADQTITETDRAISETDITVTETSVKVATVMLCGLASGYFNNWVGLGGNTDQGWGITKTNDGGYVTVGYSYDTTNGAGNEDMVIVKFNSSGVEQWSKLIGTTGTDVAYSVIEDSSQNIIVVGRASNNNIDQWMVKLNSSGVEQWTRQWGGASNDYAYDVVETNDGGYVMVGYTFSDGAGSSDQSFVKIDSSGNEVWSYTWGGTGADEAHSVIELSDNSLIVAGFTTTSEQQTLIKLNSSGAVQWVKTWGSTGTRARKVIEANDGGFLTAGRSNAHGNGSYDHTLVKYNSSGVEQWSKTWGGSAWDEAFSLDQAADGTIVVVGETSSYGAGFQEAYITTYSSSGSLLGTYAFGGANDDRAIDVKIDGSDIVFTGFTTSWPGGYNLFIGKMDLSGGNCGGICESVNVTGGDVTITEGTSSTTEAADTNTTSSITVTEADISVTETVINETPQAVSVDVGARLNGVNQNTATTAPYEGTPFRLRALLHVTNGDGTAGTFKLQFAERSGTCDTSFTGESFADVTTSTPIAYYQDNVFPDGSSFIANANDPTHSTDSVTLQEYNSTGNFDVVNTIPQNNDGLWDFALVDNGAPANTAYCFRIVDSGGTALTTYTVVPEITTAGPSLEQSGYRWFENKDGLDSLSTSEWLQAAGGLGFDRASSALQDSSGNYIVTGYTTSFGAGNNDILITKFNSDGVELWSKTWGGSSSDVGHSVIEDSSGNYIVVGETDSYTSSNDMVIIKFDSSGVEQWSKTWGGIGSDVGYSLIEDSSGNYIVTGQTTSYGTSGAAFLVQFNSSGVEQWSKTWDGSGVDQGRSVIEDTSGNFIMTGSTSSFGSGGSDVLLVQFNSSGVEQWSKTWGGSSSDVGYSLIEDSSGNYVVAGYTFSYGAGGSDVLIVKFNSSGIEQWSKTLGSSGGDQGSSLTEDSGGNYIVTGVTANAFPTQDRVLLTKFNSSGVEQWTKFIGGSGVEWGNAVLQDATGRYVIAGYSGSYGAGNNDVLLARTDTSGNIPGCSACTTAAFTEVDHLVTEVDHSVTETDRIIAEVDRTVTEADQNLSVSVVCGSIAANPNAGLLLNDTWAQTWGGTSTDVARALVQTSDGGFAVAGYTLSTGLTAGGSDQTLVKYNSSGVELWSKTWGGTDLDRAYALIETSDGGFAVAGETASPGLTAGGSDQTLVKYDSNGVEQWSKTWGGTGDDIARALVQTSDGGFAVAGETASPGLLTSGTSDQTLVKYNSSGVEQWSKTWDGTGLDRAYDLVQTSDGGFAVAGQTNGIGLTAGGIDQTLVKYDSSGVEQWSKTWGGNQSDVAYALIETSDGGFAVAGYTASTFLTSGGADQTLVKYDSSGVEQWSKSWGGDGTDYATDLVQTSDGGFAVAGVNYSTGLTAGYQDQTLVKYDSSGVEQWSKTWGGDNADFAWALVQTSDGGFAVAGETASTGLTAGSVDQTFLKFDSTGTITNCDTCIDRTVTEVDRVTAEVDRAVTEVNRATAEVDRAVTEVTRDSPQTLVHCGQIGSFFHTWGGAGNDYAYALVETSDGGFAVAGYTGSTGLTAGGADQTLVKYDSSGVEQWSKTWGGTGNDYAYALVETIDGGFAVAGETASTGLTAGSSDQTLVKYNSSGVEQWSKTWGGDGVDRAYALVQTSDGGFAVAGETWSTGLTAGAFDQTLVKYNSSGVEQWSKTWGGTGGDTARALVQTSDGGFAVAGETASPGLTAGSSDQTLVKYDSSGVEQWSKTWGGTSQDDTRALVQTSDGGFAVAGYTLSTGLTAGGIDQTLVKYDSSGVEQWSKTWGGTGDDYAYSLIQTSDGGFAVAGSTASTDLTAGGIDQTLVKYDSSGVEQWSKTWGGAVSDVAYALVQTSDGGFAVAGYTASTGLTTGTAAQTLIKIDGNGASCSGVCTSRTVTEVDRVTAEVDRAVSETDRVTAEVDRAVTEVDRAITEVVRNEALALITYAVLIGDPLNGVAQNTATTLTRSDQEFRLRLLLHDTAKFATAGQLNLKIQYAARVGTCDVNFVGENYIDVGTSTTISFNDNLYSTGDAITNSGEDPTHANHSVIYDSYVESSDFTNREATVEGSDSMWDFSFLSNGGAGSYCFRVVFNDGSLLPSYSQIPELGVPPSTGALMRHGAWFNPGTEVKEPFYW